MPTNHHSSSFRACNLCDARDFEFLFEKNNYTILKCRQCGLTFTDPVPGGDELKAIYGQDYFQGEMYNDYQREVESRSPDYRKWLSWIEKTSGLSSGSWLDIGCATGGFMQIARQKGWNICGIDLSEYCVSTAKAANLKVEIGAAQEIPPEWGQFDIISMWDTIEHLEDPLAALKTAAQRLQPGGWFVLSTGDISSIAARILGKRWWLILPPVHLYYFSRTTLDAILRKAGLTPVSVRRFGRRLRVGRAFRLLIGSKSTSTEVGPSMYFNALDIMTVLARRTSPGESVSS